MFGRVRAASSTLDSLELERAPPKLIKDDSFSIYEATLMKLKLGSQRNLEMQTGTESGCASADDPKSRGDASSAPCHDQMMIDNDCSLASGLSNYSDCRSTISLKHQESRRNVSVAYMFSKYKAKEEVMTTEDDGSSVNLSARCSECQSKGSSAGRELEHDGLSSFPVCQR